ncbi:MAG TPA: glycosyltransferase family 9 protein [Steroidobacteraceae bacterium]|nr:glycosyltransferase family 9 protein [Steroidobacteraceae bacterium]
MDELCARPPRAVVIVKLSALGDVCHTLPVVRTLQRAWPDAHFSWVIGRAEAKLLGGIPDIEFIEFDKRAGIAGYRAVGRALGRRPIDLLLHMQFAWRASLVTALVSAPVKLGYDRERALDLQWLFTTHRIEPAAREHVMDALFGFARRLGVKQRDYRWDIPIPEGARRYAEQLIPEGVPALIISPCSSHVQRNWHAAGYATVGDRAAALGVQVVICGGPTPLEQRMGAEIAARMRAPCSNVVGRDTLPEFYATLARARVLVTPDSGPAHMATSLGVPVVGLYAATNPARSGPYFSRELCVDRFDEAARRFLGRPAAELPWRTKIERPGVMDLIQPADVIGQLEAALERPPEFSPGAPRARAAPPAGPPAR